MLSGFFGLIAIVTSAGLIAVGSVMRTTCCAWAALERSKQRLQRAIRIVQDLMVSLNKEGEGNVYQRNLHSYRRDRRGQARERARVRRVCEDRLDVGASAHVPGVWRHALLRQFAESTCN